MNENKVPILKGKKNKTRILRPGEYARLRSSVQSIDKLTDLDACLLLGARYLECRRIQEHPEWFDGDFIHLPWTEDLARSRHNPERWIRLSSRGKYIMPYFFRSSEKLPSVQAWNQDLKRWSRKAGISDDGLSARALRKTYESWLAFFYPNATNMVFLSQGHTTLMSLQHYINLPFLEEDKLAMTEWVTGWL